MTPVELSRTVLRALRAAVDAGELSATVPERAHVERPRPGGRGDYASNLALRIAREAGAPPRRVAEILSARLAAEPGIARADVTGPGFLNITLDGDPGTRLVTEILARGERYGHLTPDTGELVQLHIPHELRAAVVADSARRILRSQGALVRVTCDAAPDPAWADVLGVRVDAHGRPPVPLPTLRPVPAPAEPDPLRLGRDAARWALLLPAAHDHPHTGDGHLAQRETNPLFRVRYAHSRARALTRNAAQLGFTAAPGDVRDTENAVAEAAGDDGHSLLGALGDHPAVLAAAARHRAPDRLARHLVRTADAFLARAHTVLPLGDEKPSAAHRARLALAEAAGTVLAGGLSLLGISAPAYL
ncbi:Arginine--tRNA ligase [Streptomyces sp. YIM 121038]|uniref:ArgS-related anticodon-binding protein NrtL n=1 Tax=Streptomyces sp. YIM 121038 TaxID=2136401 RepID=UPI00111077B2|nr:DALR anticodon-binding domain-containing protein [Streptomyces sp. YIM 121038]QCX79134.1 Arginine--tRNA ligase [Streptomyces sp. YIM 121038]